MVNNSIKTHILILCHAFPPHQGIGGRRWFKFADEFIKQGLDVSVISAKPQLNKTSVWNSKLNLFAHTQLPINYPSSLIKHQTGFIHKIKYRLALAFVKFFSNGNYYDRTIFWKPQVLNAVEAIHINKNITHIIISGAPFHWLSFANDIKTTYQQVKLIADIRDPYTSNHSAYGFSSLSKKRFDVEAHKEKQILKHFDSVICVNNAIAQYFKDVDKTNANKVNVIENGYDENELQIEKPQSVFIDENKINFVFTGSFYDNALYLFEVLLDHLKENEETYKTKVHFYFFGSEIDKLKNKVPTQLNHFFTFGSFNKISYVNHLISKANYGMLFLTDDINNSLSTKFCEYIKFKKKIIVFSKEGFTSQFVTNNNLGYHINQKNIKQMFIHIIELNKQDPFPNTFDVTYYSIKNLSNKVLQLLS